MIVYQDLTTEKDVASDSYPVAKADEKVNPYPKGAVIALESKKITVGTDEETIKKAIGANESKEEAVEGVDDQKETVINIVNAHKLQKIDLDVKEFKTLMQKYWQLLKATMDSKRYEALGLGKDYKVTDKKAAAAKEKEAEAKLGKAGKVELAVWTKRLESFKNNFAALSAFVKDVIIPNFKEFEFYIPEEADLGSSLIIPARYVGEAVSPTFFLFADGILEAKF